MRVCCYYQQLLISDVAVLLHVLHFGSVVNYCYQGIQAKDFYVKDKDHES